MSDHDPSVSGLPPDLQFGLLHVLRLKGFADLSAIAEALHLEAERVAQDLEALMSEGLVVQGRFGWAVSAAGAKVHGEFLEVERRALEGGALAEVYGEFLPLNSKVKEVCTRWQLRASPDGAVPNDHSDVEYDTAVIADLYSLDDQAQLVCCSLGRVLSRLDWYGERLLQARRRVELGDRTAIAAPLSGSYHDVWMELHQDLLMTMGINREEEGSF